MTTVLSKPLIVEIGLDEETKRALQQNMTWAAFSTFPPRCELGRSVAGKKPSAVIITAKNGEAAFRFSRRIELCRITFSNAPVLAIAPARMTNKFTDTASDMVVLFNPGHGELTQTLQELVMLSEAPDESSVR